MTGGSTVTLAQAVDISMKRYHPGDFSSDLTKSPIHEGNHLVIRGVLPKDPTGESRSDMKSCEQIFVDAAAATKWIRPQAGRIGRVERRSVVG